MLSYNNFDFAPIYGKKKESTNEKQNVGHESTFMKQTLYFLITLVLNVILTVETLASVTPDGMTLVDLNGIPRELTQTQVSNMVIIGWVTFFSSWMANILYYKVHPSSVDFSLNRFSEKLFIHFFGRKKQLRCICCCSCCCSCSGCCKKDLTDEEPQETLLTARGGQAEEDRMKDSVQSGGQKKTFSICGKKFNLPTCLGGCRSCFQKDSVDEEPHETPLTVMGGQAEKEKVVVDAEIEEVDKEEEEIQKQNEEDSQVSVESGKREDPVPEVAK